MEIYERFIGKYVLVRSRNEGINAGKVLLANENAIVLKNARRLWHHKPLEKTVSWYEGVAKYGLSSDSKISCAVLEKTIIEKYSVTVCTKEAEQSIKAFVSHAQS